MANEHHDRVGPLSDMSDFKVADNDPDVRGWDVISADGRKIGEVEDLIVDTSAMKVRYLDVDVDKDYRADKDHRILIPIGQAQLHEKEDHVHVNALSSTEVRAAPRYSGKWSRTEEETVRRHYGTDTGRTADSEYYSHKHYDDSSFFGSRRGAAGAAAGTSASGRSSSGDTRSSIGRSGEARSVEGEERLTLSEEQLKVSKERHESGEMRVGKHVETEHVSRDIPVEREVATVERHRIDPSEARNAKPRITDDEIRVPLTEEEVVVEKRAVPKEELVVKKERVQETKHVEADLKKERADVRQDDSTRGNRG
jgi:photosynthetic reaction center H subunit